MHPNHTDISRLVKRGITPGHPRFLTELQKETRARGIQNHEYRCRSLTFGSGFTLSDEWDRFDAIDDPKLKGGVAVFRSLLPGIGRVEVFKRGAMERVVIHALGGAGASSVVAEWRGTRLQRIL